MRKLKTKEWWVPVLIWITLINLFSVVKISAGERYVARLNRWYSLASLGKWTAANKLEKKLDPADTEWYKNRNKTEDLKIRLNELTIRSDKTADDWMEVASIQGRLQKTDEAKVSVKKAHELDPVRSDIEKIYFSSF
ncbi:MAG: hypothetical protein UU09_C0040G0003 [Microgenomates group bacterium GW2011_GWA2_40_6]|nr:MAG: hypothetical protein UU09_C0040G0003 [Microgenomates group bacterium GW2011_GWA2_40_6]